MSGERRRGGGRGEGERVSESYAGSAFSMEPDSGLSPTAVGL